MDNNTDAANRSMRQEVRKAAIAATVQKGTIVHVSGRLGAGLTWISGGLGQNDDPGPCRPLAPTTSQEAPC